MTSKLDQAIKMACKLHANQTRKTDNMLPYISHPFSVMTILSEYTSDENLKISALLHDVLEDTDCTPEELEEQFGSEIRESVEGVSNVSEKKDWKERKQDYINKLSEQSEGTLMVAAADKIHNMQCLMEEFSVMGENLFDIFNPGWEEREWYYNEILNLLKSRLDSEIVEEYEEVLKQTSEVLNL